MDLIQQLATELKISGTQVESVVTLLDSGFSVPFIACYRRATTGGLGHAVLRRLEERLCILRRFCEKQQAAVECLTGNQDEQASSAALVSAVSGATSLAQLADLSPAFKPPRHTDARVAEAAGLLPLAEALSTQAIDAQGEFIQSFICPEKSVASVAEVLAGAKAIWAERFTKDVLFITSIHRQLQDHATLIVEPVNEQQARAKKYFDGGTPRPLFSIPTHRLLHLLRGRRERLIKLDVAFENEAALLEQLQTHWLKEITVNHDWFTEVVFHTWHNKLRPKFALVLLNSARERAETDAINGFADKYRALLMQPAAGAVMTMGIETGHRGCLKVAVIDGKGDLLDTTVVYPFENHWQQSLIELAKLASQHQVALIGIGTGARQREAEKLFTALMQLYPDLALRKKVVSNAGIEALADTELAKQEHPGMDLGLIAAVSIARRVQDPLAEVAKIPPVMVKVHPHQADVTQARLAQVFEKVREDCVCQVGVDINTANESLLDCIPELGSRQIRQIVSHRLSHGVFESLDALCQCLEVEVNHWVAAIGFLRVNNGQEALDQTSIHPQDYPLVKMMAKSCGVEAIDLLANTARLATLKVPDFVTAEHNLEAVKNLLSLLAQAKGDPRPKFGIPTFKAGVGDFADLRQGMVLEGQVSSITDYGVFVDIGIRQDGLVHISELTNQFVRDPREVVQAGQVVKVVVVTLDDVRKRVGLSIKQVTKSTKQAVPPQKHTKAKSQRKVIKQAPKHKVQQCREHQTKSPINTAMRDAFAKLKEQ